MNWWFGDFWSDFAFGIRFKRLEFNLVCAIGFDSRLLYAKKEIWLLGYNFRAYLFQVRVVLMPALWPVGCVSLLFETFLDNVMQC